MLFATLDQYEFAQGDYGRQINFVIYQEDRSTAYNLTGYTVTVRVLDSTMTQTLQDITATIDTAASGTGHFVTTQTNTWGIADSANLTSEYYFIELELSKNGEVTSCYPVRVNVYASPYP